MFRSGAETYPDRTSMGRRVGFLAVPWFVCHSTPNHRKTSQRRPSIPNPVTQTLTGSGPGTIRPEPTTCSHNQTRIRYPARCLRRIPERH